MAVLVHLVPENDAPKVARRGLRASRLYGEPARGVFCMPLVPDYFVSHQWLRELKRRGARSFVAIDFRVASDEPIYVGHYGHEHVATTVGRAVRILLEQEDRRGWEFILPRAVDADEIIKVRPVSRVVGWRYSPDAHQRKPCPCDYCGRGLYGARRTRERLDPPTPRLPMAKLVEHLEQAISVRGERAIDEAISLIALRRDRAARRRIEALLEHPLALVRRLAAAHLPPERDPE